MRRTLITGGVLAVLALAILAFATPASAAGCGEGFDLLTVDVTISRVDHRIFDDAEWQALQLRIASADANGDGLLCSKHYKPNQGQDKHWIGPEDVGVTDYIICLFTDNKAEGRD
jgi:hypothetical protein